MSLSQASQVVVMKFGGTSLGSLERIQAAAYRVVSAKEQGIQPVVVVSAMAGETDRLVSLVRGFETDDDEYSDLAISTGEQVSCALMAMALRKLKVNPVTMLARDIGLTTTSRHGDADIVSMLGSPVLEAVLNHQVPVIAGFQGLDRHGRITTLGRGGSDTTAVAVAAAVGARRCEIYTDVDGVYDLDPRRYPTAKKYQSISYDKMQELADQKAKVLHAKSVRLAKAYRVEIYVRSSFVETAGTVVTHLQPSDIGIPRDPAPNTQEKIYDRV